MGIISQMYISALPVLLGGVANMIFVKTPIYKKLNYPIDGYIEVKGKRIFGDNKTYIGFVSMIVLTMIFQIVWGMICKNFDIYNEVYLYRDNTYYLNCLVGFWYGFAYMICELPNSFIKRRINIPPGKTTNKIFLVIDQIDSLFGVFLVLMFFNRMSIWRYLFYIFLGGLTHIGVNSILYWLKVRRNV